ncbi:hypothetical protein CLIB1444_16S00760 [[Candida] jaroonii]|uniref:Uncharacterized protein n=1 Tax=[Candida] jaroonii TaxID=467808 RepID=A0ACA9YEL1_9ASCO|nr:hypothetical protein CLIB1444_16S00760 [[Candida] jaroonii]
MSLISLGREDFLQAHHFLDGMKVPELREVARCIHLSRTSSMKKQLVKEAIIETMDRYRDSKDNHRLILVLVIIASVSKRGVGKFPFLETEYGHLMSKPNPNEGFNNLLREYCYSSPEEIQRAVAAMHREVLAASSASTNTSSSSWNGNEVRFKPNPFYDIIRRITHVPQYSNGGNKKRDIIIKVQIGTSLIQEIESNDYRICAFVGKAPIGSGSTFHKNAYIEYPNRFEIRINDHKLDASLGRGRKNDPSTNKPFDLTGHISTTGNNVVVLSFIDDFPYLVYVNLVKFKSVETVMSEHTFGHITEEEELRNIKKYFENEDEISISNIKVSLVDTVTLARIKTAVKSKNCEHFQCFDLTMFLQLQQQSYYWACPVCSVKFNIQDLVISDLFDKLAKTSKSDSILIEEDGTINEIAEEDSHSTTPMPNTTTTTNITTQKEKEKQATPMIEEIIILSSSEDEDEEDDQDIDEHTQIKEDGSPDNLESESAETIPTQVVPSVQAEVQRPSTQSGSQAPVPPSVQRPVQPETQRSPPLAETQIQPPQTESLRPVQHETQRESVQSGPQIPASQAEVQGPPKRTETQRPPPQVQRSPPQAIQRPTGQIETQGPPPQSEIQGPPPQAEVQRSRQTESQSQSPQTGMISEPAQAEIQRPPPQAEVQRPPQVEVHRPPTQSFSNQPPPQAEIQRPPTQTDMVSKPSQPRTKQPQEDFRNRGSIPPQIANPQSQTQTSVRVPSISHLHNISQYSHHRRVRPPPGEPRVHHPPPAIRFDSSKNSNRVVNPSDFEPTGYPPSNSMRDSSRSPKIQNLISPPEEVPPEITTPIQNPTTGKIWPSRDQYPYSFQALREMRNKVTNDTQTNHQNLTYSQSTPNIATQSPSSVLSQTVEGLRLSATPNSQRSGYRNFNENSEAPKDNTSGHERGRSNTIGNILPTTESQNGSSSVLVQPHAQHLTNGSFGNSVPQYQPTISPAFQNRTGFNTTPLNKSNTNGNQPKRLASLTPPVRNGRYTERHLKDITPGDQFRKTPLPVDVTVITISDSDSEEEFDDEVPLSRVSRTTTNKRNKAPEISNDDILVADPPPESTSSPKRGLDSTESSVNKRPNLLGINPMGMSLDI